MGAPGFNPRMLLAMLASKAGAAGGNAGSGATGTGTADAAVGDATNQLQGADPAYALKQLMDLKRQLVSIITTQAFRVPGAARALSSCLKGIDSGIKEMQQAQSTAEAVSGGPVGLSAIPQASPNGAMGAAPPQGAGGGM